MYEFKINDTQTKAFLRLTVTTSSSMSTSRTWGIIPVPIPWIVFLPTTCDYTTYWEWSKEEIVRNA